MSKKIKTEEAEELATLVGKLVEMILRLILQNKNNNNKGSPV